MSLENKNENMLVSLNYKWWQTPNAKEDDSFISFMDRDDVIKENEYDLERMIKLNRHMITFDSQATLETLPEKPHEYYLAEVAKTKERYDKMSRPCYDKQKAYISALVPSSTFCQLSKKANNKRIFILPICDEKLYEKQLIKDGHLPLTKTIWPQDDKYEGFGKINTTIAIPCIEEDESDQKELILERFPSLYPEIDESVLEKELQDLRLVHFVDKAFGKLATNKFQDIVLSFFEK